MANKLVRSLLCVAALLSPVAAQADSARAESVRRDFGNLPLFFEVNQGQADPRVRFLSRAGRHAVLVTQNGGVTVSGNGARIAMSVAGAAPSPLISAEQPLGGVSNYYIGNRAITGVSHYGRVRAHQVRPGVDLVYYGNGRQLEYDLEFQPGASPEKIRLRFEGSRKPVLDRNGDLILRSGQAEFRQHKPVAWQETSQGRVPVECDYQVLGSGEVQFALGRYDARLPLVVDPILSYATFLGGTNGAETLYGIAADSTGAVYVTGLTSSTDFPVTSGSKPGSHDAFVAKLSPNGNSIVYSTFIGGSSNDYANAIAIDNSGNAYIAGYTESSNFPAGAASYDGFVAKIGPAGTLVWSRLISGNSTDSATSIAVDGSGNAYVAGYTYSASIGTSGALRQSSAGGQDAFAAKFSTAGAIQYCTHIGGTSEDFATAAAVDTAGNVHVTGTSYSGNFPVSANALSSTRKGSSDAFVSVVNPAGTELTYSSFLGGSNSESGTGIALDSTGAVFVTGTTYSTDFPTTAGAFSAAPPSNYLSSHVGFLVRFIPGTVWATGYSTYLSGGDSYQTRPRAVAVDASGSAYVAGDTSSTNFPTTLGALITPRANVSMTKSFLSRVSVDGSTLIYSTLFGGWAGTDETTAIALDGNGAVYLAGWTGNWNTWPTTPGAYQSTLSKTNTYYGTGTIVKIDMASNTQCLPQITPATATVVPSGGSTSFNLTLAPGCPWEAVPTDGRLKVTPPVRGMGSAAAIPVNVTVPANDSTYSSVTSTVQVGTATFTVTQQPWSCSDPVLTPTTLSFEAAGGLRTVSLATPYSCYWSASADAPWISIQGATSGNGNRSISVNVAPNSFGARSGSLTIAGRKLVVSQSAGSCTAVVTAPPTFSATGGSTLTTLITSRADCAWTAHSYDPWIRVSSVHASGAGNATIPFNVAPNPGTVPRTGRLLIGDKVLSVTQVAGPGVISTQYSATTFAGGGNSLGDGGPATAALLSAAGVALRDTGSVVITDTSNNGRIREVTTDGNIQTIVGGEPGTSMSPAAIATLPGSPSVWFSNGNKVQVLSNGAVTTIAGTGSYGTSGDNGPATSATLSSITSLAISSAGDVYIATGGAVRKVSGGIITKFAGGGSAFADGVVPTATSLNAGGIAFDPAGNLLITDMQHSRIRKISGGVITTIAGGGTLTSDGIPATSAIISPREGIAVDSTGAILFVDGVSPSRIRRIGADGRITTLYSSWDYIYKIAAEPSGSVYFLAYSRVYKLTPVPAFCTYTLNSPAGLQSPLAGFTNLSITTEPGCSWSVSAPYSWVALSTGGGTGSGVLTLHLAANLSPTSRAATVTVGDQAITITQAAYDPSTYTISGRITRSGVPLAGVPVRLTGSVESTTWTNAAGVYVHSGLPGGGNYVVTPVLANHLFSPAEASYGILSMNATADFTATAAAPQFFLQNQLTNTVSTWVMGGANGSAIQYAPQILTAAPNWKPVASADFDGNGWADIVLQNSQTWDVSIWYMGGPQGIWMLSAPIVHRAVPGWRVVAAADFDRNGNVDLVLQNDTSNAVSIWYLGGSNGLALLSAPIIYNAVPGWKVKGAGDFDRSGIPDLVLQNETTNEVSIWYLGGSNGSLLLNAPVILRAAANWKIVGASDLNADGTPDMVLQNAVTNEVSVWYMGGAQGMLPLSTPVIAVAAPNWKLLATR